MLSDGTETETLAVTVTVKLRLQGADDDKWKIAKIVHDAGL